MIAPRCNLARRRRCEIQQCLDGAARAAAGTQLEYLAEEDQHNDHCGGFKVDGNLALVSHRVRKYAGREHRNRTQDVCRAHSDADQREHVQLTRHDGTPSAMQ